MKKLLSLGFMLISFSACYTSFGQSKMLNELTITPPSFHNTSYENLYAQLSAVIEYPAESINKGLQGTEVIRFEVTASGEIEGLSVTNSVSPEIDKTVTRALQATSGSCDPCTIYGIPASMAREISITFALISYENMFNKAKQYMQHANYLMFKREKPEKALTVYNKLVTMFPNDESVLIGRGICLEKLGRTLEAQQDRERARIVADRKESVTLPYNNAMAINYSNMIPEVIITAR